MNTTTSSTFTTLTFFKYTNLRDQIWAFGMMQFAHKPLSQQPGIQFYKLMGSGKGMGFNPFPDWTTYALLIVWKEEASAQAFFESSDLFQKYKEHTAEIWTLYLKNIIARGTWSKQQPFESHAALNPANDLLCIITRATIRWKKLATFWRYVPTSERPLVENPDLLFTKGIGEAPIVQMATFSIWKSMDALKAFAYKSKEHQEAIRKTKELNWYSEELFARFQPFRSVGTWGGINPLAKYEAILAD